MMQKKKKCFHNKYIITLIGTFRGEKELENKKIYHSNKHFQQKDGLNAHRQHMKEGWNQLSSITTGLNKKY